MNFNSDTNAVEIATRRLRAKPDDTDPVKLIYSVRKAGYVLESKGVT